MEVQEDKEEKKKSNLMSPEGRSSVMRVLRLVEPEKRLLLLAMSTIVVTTPISLFFPMAVGKLLDVATTADPIITPVTVAGALLVVFGLQGLMMTTRDGMLTVAGERMAARLRRQTFEAVLRQDMSFFDETRTGELLNRLASDTSVIQKAITNNVTSALKSAGMVVGCTAMLIYTSPKLALVSVLVLPPGGIVAVYMGRFMKRKQSEVQDALAKTSQQAEEVITSMKTVRQFAREANEAARYGGMMAETRQLATSVGIANTLLGTGIHVAANISLACVLGYGGTLVVAGEMTAGVLTSFLLYSVYLGFNVGSLSGIYGDLMKAVGASLRIFSILDREPSLPAYDSRHTTELGARLDDFNGGVEFKDVVFRYPTRPQSAILQGFTLKMEPGQVIGIVGASGSGKSTIGALLTRLYDPEQGTVLLDGHNVKDLSAEWLRGVVASVPQEPVLFAVSIADNIRYGRLDATDDEVRRVAEVANAHEFISRFPDGYDTFVGERGMQLSGGQKQRLAIARALIKQPKVLLLDEATSALDSESEKLVEQAIERVSHAGMTVVKIAHRLNTIRDADVICMVVKGKVEEKGSYAELMKSNGAFKQLVKNQTSDYH
uniref:ABC transporter n=1 Tax=Hemiselmis andersenii TaxID=464988 RepID=A0A7S0THF0_HEMAN